MKAVRAHCYWHTFHPWGAIWSKITGERQGMHSKWLTLTCLDCHALVTREDHLHLGGFLACLPQSVQDAMPEGWQGLGEPRLLLVLNANSATTASVLKKTPRYHGCEVGKCMDYGASGFGGVIGGGNAHARGPGREMEVSNDSNKAEEVALMGCANGEGTDGQITP